MARFGSVFHSFLQASEASALAWTPASQKPQDAGVR